MDIRNPHRQAGGSRRGHRAPIAGVVLFCLTGIHSAGQQFPTESPPQFPPPGLDSHSSRYPHKSIHYGDSEAEGQAGKRIRAINAERYRQMLSDAARLVKIAEELNRETAGSDAATMTPEQLRKLGEIAKLAKSVKDKMSYSVGALPESTDLGRPSEP